MLTSIGGANRSILSDAAGAATALRYVEMPAHSAPCGIAAGNGIVGSTDDRFDIRDFEGHWKRHRRIAAAAAVSVADDGLDVCQPRFHLGREIRVVAVPSPNSVNPFEDVVVVDILNPPPIQRVVT